MEEHLKQYPSLKDLPKGRVCRLGNHDNWIDPEKDRTINAAAQHSVAAVLAFGWGLRWYVLRPRNQYNEPGLAQPARQLKRKLLGCKCNKKTS